MAYTRQTWQDGASGGTPLSAARLNTIEAGLAAAAAVADSAAAASTVEAVQDVVGGLIKAGSNVTVAYDDANGTFTINATGGTGGGSGGTVDAESVRDTIGAALVAGTGIQITVDDAGDTITIRVANLTKSMVGLDQVDNTTDLNKPVSNATVDALNLRATKAMTEGLVNHDGTTGGGTRPTGWFRIRWVGGSARPTNALSVDVWERDAA